MATSYIPYDGPIVTLTDARTQRAKRFFTGIPCRWGHISQRYINGNGCFECTRLRVLRLRPLRPITPMFSSIDGMFGNSMPITECGCWAWMGVITKEGYGRLAIMGKNKLAHRVSYELVCGPIPEELELDHLCRVRSCINPRHLEPVTRKVNAQRGISGRMLAARHRAITHCPAGHAYAGYNVRINLAGARECRACHREHQRKYVARLRTASGRS